jgi:hypothetical protein
MAIVDGKKVFGGYINGSPSWLKTFQDNVNHYLNHQVKNEAQNTFGSHVILHNIYPVAATFGYLHALPILLNANNFVLIVIPTAGEVTLNELIYVKVVNSLYNDNLVSFAAPHGQFAIDSDRNLCIYLEDDGT